ncbi:MAG: hypothetical protein M3P83_13875 [Actinomycetota bacterium]|nr:hypothetical protein [Actinomycetota bacterium]
MACAPAFRLGVFADARVDAAFLVSGFAAFLRAAFSGAAFLRAAFSGAAFSGAAFFFATAFFFAAASLASAVAAGRCRAAGFCGPPVVRAVRLTALLAAVDATGSASVGGAGFAGLAFTVDDFRTVVAVAATFFAGRLRADVSVVFSATDFVVSWGITGTLRVADVDHRRCGAARIGRGSDGFKYAVHWPEPHRRGWGRVPAERSQQRAGDGASPVACTAAKITPEPPEEPVVRQGRPQ